MPTTLDRPQAVTERQSVAQSPKEFVAIAEQASKTRRGFLERYQQHLWLAGLSILVIAVALSPFAMGYLSRQPAASKPVAATAISTLPTSVTITASEFKF